jgi:aspartate racemase
MRPAATADFYQKLIQATPAKADQDHFKVLIFSNPHVPDRTAAIRGEGVSLLPALIAGAETLIRAGADFLAIPCVTAHFFFDDLQRAVRVPILHMIHETVAAISTERATLRRFGLLATSGTLATRLFEAAFEPEGLTVLTPEAEVQASRVMKAIYAVKGGESSEVPRRLIREAASHLGSRGAEAIIAGCTEVPLILRDGDLAIPIIDPTWILARAAVRCALNGEPSGLRGSVVTEAPPTTYISGDRTS